MKLLLNMNLPPSLSEHFADSGHTSRHTGEIGMSEAPDSHILAAARASGEIVVTHDLDYGELLAFSGDMRPSVVILRVTDVRIGTIARRVLTVLDEHADDLEAGAVVVIGDGNIRVRRLPIG